MSLHFRTIPFESLDYISEAEKLKVVTDVLEDSSLAPEQLLYTGVEGKFIKETGSLPRLPETFGHTFAEYSLIAHNIDRDGCADGNTPLWYALSPDIKVPAIVTYNIDDLVESDKVMHVWQPEPHSSLNEAARLVIFIAT